MTNLGGTGVSENTDFDDEITALFDRQDRLNPATLAAWQADPRAKLNDVVTLAERVAGQGGGATGVVISGTANPFDILAHGSLPLSLVLRDITNIKQLGAIDQLAFDGTTFVQRMADTKGYVSQGVSQWTNKLEIGVITTTRKTLFDLQKVLLLDVGSNAVAFNLNHADSLYVGNVDGGGGYRSAVNLNADRCEFIGRVDNLTSTDDSTAWQSGVEINSGEHCQVTILAKNHIRTASNDSIPRVVTAQGTSSKWHINKLDGEDVNGGLAHTTDGTFDFVNIKNATDNGLYNLAGKVVGSTLIYDGSEEGIVHKGDVRLGYYSFSGSGIPIGLENGGDLIIGAMNLGGNPLQVARLRSGNSSTDKLEIGQITGKLNTTQFFGLFTGVIKKLILPNIDVSVEYVHSTAASNWIDLTSVTEEFHVKNWTIRLTDTEDALSASVRLNIVFPTTVTTLSSAKDLDFYVSEADGITPAVADVRMFNLAKDNVIADGFRWQANIGPYGREATANGGQRDSVSTNVVAGTWRKGTDLVLSSAVSAPFRTRNTVSGPPGTWTNY